MSDKHRWREPVSAAAGDKTDVTPAPVNVPPQDSRFVQTEPFIELAPNEVFIPPTIDELAAGSIGRIRNTVTGEERVPQAPGEPPPATT